jgi:hypothetical protein
LSRKGCTDDDDVAITFGKDSTKTPAIESIKIGNQVDIE